MAHLKNSMSEKLKRLLQLSAEKGVSNRLTLANYNPAIFSVPPPPPSPPGTRNLSKSTQAEKSPDNSNMFTFLTITHTGFITAYKHVLFPSYVIQVI